MLTFGEKLKVVRKAKNITQATLAEMTGISVHSISNYEKHGKIAKSSNVLKLAHVLEVRPEYFLDPEDEDPGDKIDPDKYCEMIERYIAANWSRLSKRLLVKARDLLKDHNLTEEEKEHILQAIWENYENSISSENHEEPAPPANHGYIVPEGNGKQYKKQALEQQKVAGWFDDNKLVRTS